MERSTPSCGECGDLEVVLAGVHPGDAGVVRWTLFGCGHVATEVAGDDPSHLGLDDPRPISHAVPTS